MAHDLIDRRPRGRIDAGDESDGDRWGGRARPCASLWESLGFDLSAGSPGLADHDAARVLIRELSAWIAGAAARPMAGGTRGVRPSRSTRHGAQPKGERNVAAFLLSAALGLSPAEVGAELGISRTPARAAIGRGRAIVAEHARSKTDPRRPSAAGRPWGRNERPW